MPDSSPSCPLDRLPAGDSAVVLSCSGPSSFRLHELGLLPGTLVRVLRRAPLGDPIQVQVGQSTFALRQADAAAVTVAPARRAASAVPS
jgi:Fe2+ transport system protein FeoA